MSKQDDRRAAVNKLRRATYAALDGRANALSAVRLHDFQMILDHVDELELERREGLNSGDKHG